jgi:hypothetical protein
LIEFALIPDLSFRIDIHELIFDIGIKISIITLNLTWQGQSRQRDSAHICRTPDRHLLPVCLLRRAQMRDDPLQEAQFSGILLTAGFVPGPAIPFELSGERYSIAGSFSCGDPDEDTIHTVVCLLRSVRRLPVPP